MSAQVSPSVPCCHAYMRCSCTACSCVVVQKGAGRRVPRVMHCLTALIGVPVAAQARWLGEWMAICTAMQTRCAWLRLSPVHRCPCTTASPWTMRELPNDIPSLLLARSRCIWVTREPFIQIYA